MSSCNSNNIPFDEEMSDSEKDESDNCSKNAEIPTKNESEEIKINNLIEKISKILKNFITNNKNNNNTNPNGNFFPKKIYNI